MPQSSDFRHSPFRHRDFRIFWTGSFFSSIGSQFTNVAMAWQIYELTHSPFHIGLLGLARALPQIVLLLFAGLLADLRRTSERVAAPPGSKTYGSLSILTQVYCDVRIALRVPPGAFRPPPKVESAVLHLRPLASPRVDAADLRRFHAVVRAAFAQRRKTLANALAAGLGVPVDAARQAAGEAGVDPARRAETLDIKEFAALARRL